MRDVDCHDLAGCVYAFDQGTRKKVLENLSTRYRDEVEEKAVNGPLLDEEKLFASVSDTHTKRLSAKKEEANHGK